MRFAVLTRQNSRFGLKLLPKLRERGLVPVAIGIERVTWRARWRMARLLARKTSWGNAVWHNVRIWCGLLRRQSVPPYGDWAPQVLTTTDMNGPEMERFLAGLELDLLVLGQSGIIRPGLLKLPRIGTLNAHPGLLPAFRGVDVVRWSLWKRQSVGATLHFADEGIDTGDIIQSQPVTVQPDDTIEAVEKRVEELSLSMLVECVAQIAAGVTQPRTPQNRAAGNQYFLMPPWIAWRLKREWKKMRGGVWQQDWQGLTGPERLVRDQSRFYAQNLLRWLSPPASSRVLDFGCGCGYVAKELASQVAHITLCDLSAPMRQQAKRAVSECPNAEVLDTANLGDRRFDLIVVNSVVQYFQPDELRTRFDDWRTHLAAGGRVVLSDLIPPSNSLLDDVWDLAHFALRENLFLDLIRYALRYPFEYARARHNQPLLHVSPQQITQMAEAAGLRAVLAPHNMTHFRSRFTVLLTDATSR
jgi:SAM-dependent methyltransferase